MKDQFCHFNKAKHSEASVCCRRLVDYFHTLEPSLGSWGLQVREQGGAVAINVIFAQGHSDHNRRVSLQIIGTSGGDFIITYTHN